MNLEQSRKAIDEIDQQLVKLFTERMACAAEIAAYKKENNLPVLDAGRERQKLAAISEMAPDDLENSARCLYSLIFSLSRAYQHRLLGNDAELPKKIAAAIESTPNLFPPKAMVACQGVEGAYSQLACEKLFQAPNILYFSNFEAVFSAIEKGLCQYGIIPLENSTAGSVNKVYDLMLQHEFYIVRSTRLKVDHSLLVRPGTKLEDIREVYSHEQAIGQSQEFLKTLPNAQIIRCENTAQAAKFVAESGRNDVAALASRTCGALYGLTALAESVQDQGNNYTRFICISKNLEIYPGADRTSLAWCSRTSRAHCIRCCLSLTPLASTSTSLKAVRFPSAILSLRSTLTWIPPSTPPRSCSSWQSFPASASSSRTSEATAR